MGFPGQHRRVSGYGNVTLPFQGGTISELNHEGHEDLEEHESYSGFRDRS
jgi:hypothetical protein